MMLKVEREDKTSFMAQGQAAGRELPRGGRGRRRTRDGQDNLFESEQVVCWGREGEVEEEGEGKRRNNNKEKKKNKVDESGSKQSCGAVLEIVWPDQKRKAMSKSKGSSFPVEGWKWLPIGADCV